MFYISVNRTNIALLSVLTRQLSGNTVSTFTPNLITYISHRSKFEIWFSKTKKLGRKPRSATWRRAIWNQTRIVGIVWRDFDKTRLWKQPHQTRRWSTADFETNYGQTLALRDNRPTATGQYLFHDGDATERWWRRKDSDGFRRQV